MKTEELDKLTQKVLSDIEPIPHIQTEVFNILQVQATFATKESLLPIRDNINNIMGKLDQHEDEQGRMKEVMRKTERQIETNHKDVMAEIESLKSRVDSIEDQLNGLKKQIGLLDDKLKTMAKAAVSGGNPAAGGLLDDLEKELAALRQDHE